MADYTVSNETSMADLKRQVEDIIARIK